MYIIKKIIAFCLLVILLSAINKKPVTDSAESKYNLLGSREMPLYNRDKTPFVAEAMKKNILLELYYISGRVTEKNDINWDEIDKPFNVSVVLYPGELFSFHEDVLSQFNGKFIKSPPSHFQSSEGFVSDGYLFGDGVCHLASLINWAAKDAGLEVRAPTNHDFAKIPDIPKEYGVAVYNSPRTPSSSRKQNLYIINNKKRDINLFFVYDGENLRISVFEAASPAI